MGSSFAIDGLPDPVQTELDVRVTQDEFFADLLGFDPEWDAGVADAGAGISDSGMDCRSSGALMEALSGASLEGRSPSWVHGPAQRPARRSEPGEGSVQGERPPLHQQPATRERKRIAQANYRKRLRTAADDMASKISDVRSQVNRELRRRCSLKEEACQLTARQAAAAEKLLQLHRQAGAEARPPPQAGSRAISQARLSCTTSGPEVPREPDPSSCSSTPPAADGVHAKLRPRSRWFPLTGRSPPLFEYQGGLDQFAAHAAITLSDVLHHAQRLGDVDVGITPAALKDLPLHALPNSVAAVQEAMAAQLQLPVDDVCWHVQTPVEIAPGATLSFTSHFGTRECHTALVMTSLLTFLEGHFLYPDTSRKLVTAAQSESNPSASQMEMVQELMSNCNLAQPAREQMQVALEGTRRGVTGGDVASSLTSVASRLVSQAAAVSAGYSGFLGALRALGKVVTGADPCTSENAGGLYVRCGINSIHPLLPALRYSLQAVCNKYRASLSMRSFETAMERVLEMISNAAPPSRTLIARFRQTMPQFAAERVRVLCVVLPTIRHVLVTALQEAKGSGCFERDTPADPSPLAAMRQQFDAAQQHHRLVLFFIQANTPQHLSQKFMDMHAPLMSDFCQVNDTAMNVLRMMHLDPFQLKCLSEVWQARVEQAGQLQKEMEEKAGSFKRLPSPDVIPLSWFAWLVQSHTPAARSTLTGFGVTSCQHTWAASLIGACPHTTATAEQTLKEMQDLTKHSGRMRASSIMQALLVLNSEQLLIWLYQRVPNRPVVDMLWLCKLAHQQHRHAAILQSAERSLQLA